MKPTLNLTIRRGWLDMIVAGEKKEEYRSLDCKQVARLWNASEKSKRFPGPIVAVFRAGYRMDSEACAVLVDRLERRTPTRETDWIPDRIENLRYDWGEPTSPHFALHIDRVLCFGPYSNVKEFLKGGGAA